MIDTGPGPLVTVILRGLAASATGSVSASTPLRYEALIFARSTASPPNVLAWLVPDWHSPRLSASELPHDAGDYAGLCPA